MFALICSKHAQLNFKNIFKRSSFWILAFVGSTIAAVIGKQAGGAIHSTVTKPTVGDKASVCKDLIARNSNDQELVAQLDANHIDVLEFSKCVCEGIYPKLQEYLDAAAASSKTGNKKEIIAKGKQLSDPIKNECFDKLSRRGLIR